MRRGRLAAFISAPALLVIVLGLALHEPSATILTVSRETSDARVTLVGAGDELDVESPIVITAEGGTLVEVDVLDAQGHPIDGATDESGTTWTSSMPELPFGATYTVRATAVDSFGVPSMLERTVSTTVAEGAVQAIISPWDHADMGVGMPITIDFSSAVIDRAAVEQRLTVDSDIPVTGSWSWTSDTQITYRPRDFWPANAEIMVKADLRGVEVAPGVFGDADQTATWNTLRSQVLYVDGSDLTLRVVRDGLLIKSIPVTVGKDGFDTMSGTKVVMTREPQRVMDTSTAGVPADDPNAYRVKVKYAMRLTWSGEFFHASPWAAEDWGVRRSSHGCISMSEADAKWLFENVAVGDPVVVTGTAKQQDDGNGITVWNVPWEEWVAGSAL